MADAPYDVIVLGGGPAGYTAAIRAAQLELKTLCVDERASAGGTCLHVGCVPSKALLDSTRRLARALSDLPALGIEVGDGAVDLAALMARKDAVVEQLTSGIDGLLEKHGVERVQGRGELLGGGEIRVRANGGRARSARGRHVLLATGSAPVELSELPADGERVLTSTDALALGEVPEHLLVVGGGYIGLELGSVWQRLGADVTVIEREERLLPEMDEELAEHVERRLEADGIAIRLGAAVSGAEVSGDGVRLELGDEDEVEGSHALVAVGRRPVTDGLGLEDAGVELDERGFVRTDARFRTSAAGVYAIGDVCGEPMLAHKGLLEALACVDALAGRGSGHVHYAAIPAVVYTWPEVASVGATESELSERDVPYRVGRASFRHDARALCCGEAEGFVKLLAERGSDRLLGAQLFGPDAGTAIHELVLALELGGSVEEIGLAPHAHPTVNETLREAALALHGRAIHQ